MFRKIGDALRRFMAGRYGSDKLNQWMLGLAIVLIVLGLIGGRAGSTILAVLGIWYAVGHWNSYFNAFLYLTDKNLYPLQIFLRQILLQNNFDADLMDEDMLAQIQNLQEVLKYAIIVISTAPLMLIYPFVQKYFVKGVMIGSIKE